MTQTTSPYHGIPEPSPEEMNDWADGIVYALAPDGTSVYFDPEQRVWLPCPYQTKSTISDSTSS